MFSLLTTTAIVHNTYAHNFDVVRRTVRLEVDDHTGCQHPHLVAETYLAEDDTRQGAEDKLRTIMNDVAERGGQCLR